MKIAIVGAGVSGLVAAYLLDAAHEVSVFEAADRPGGHTNTIRVDTADQTHQVDTGFIVYNDRNYPLFQRLLSRLGVATQPSSMTFSVADEHGDFEYSGASPNGIYAKRSHVLTPSFQRMLLELPRFQRAARELVAAPADATGPSLGDWLEQQRFSPAFVQRLIVPQASAVWSADPHQMWTFPARFLAEFFDNHGMLALRGRPRWRTVAGGSARYVDALVARLRAPLRLGTPVHSVARADDSVLVTPRGGEPERFDRLVLATHSDQALALLSDPSPAESRMLSAVPYQLNEAVLHTDVRMLPRRRRAWASWNYHLLERPGDRTTVTYHMNRLQSLRATAEFCVTLNRTAEIDPAHVIRTIDYAHPVYTREGVAAQEAVARLSGERHTHFCGAWCGWGFHEDGVASAQRVAERLGVATL